MTIGIMATVMRDDMLLGMGKRSLVIFGDCVIQLLVLSIVPSSSFDGLLADLRQVLSLMLHENLFLA